MYCIFVNDNSLHNLIRYTAVRVLQSTVDTSEEIWYQFILEACARKYQPNKELREKHGVLEISLLAEKVCTIWAWKCHFFLTGTALGYPPRAAVYRKNSVERGSPRVSTKFVSIDLGRVREWQQRPSNYWEMQDLPVPSVLARGCTNCPHYIHNIVLYLLCEYTVTAHPCVCVHTPVNT